MPKSTVHLDRTKSNPLFENWKLSRGLSVSELHVTLDGHVTVLDHGTDYLNTRAAVLHNHINCQNGRYLVFKTHDGVNTLCEVTGEQQIAIKTVWEPSHNTWNSNASQQTEAANSALQPSVAVVQGVQSSQRQQFIVSSGHGDVTLLDARSPQDALGPCFPLKLAEPPADTRALHLEAAFQTTSGQIQVIAWAVRQKDGAQAAGCEIYLFTLAHDRQAAGNALSVQAVELLQMSALPPHAVTVQPESGVIVIAASHPELQQDTAAKPPPQASQAGGDDDVDSVSPRTLRQAADRLARFTSDQPADEAVPRNEFSDLYNEVGPDNVGGMGSEPACTVSMFVVSTGSPQVNRNAGPTEAHDPVPEAESGAQEPAEPSTHSQAVSSADATQLNQEPDITPIHPQPVAVQQSGGGTVAGDTSSQHTVEQPLYRLAEQIECDPHKVVAVMPGQQQEMLLGLSNDVDCAVVRFKAAGSALVSEHLHTIPALAYVAAGKIHKKFTLLGHPTSKLAAAVVEGNRFSYVYKHTQGRQSTGDSQIIDMGLEEKSASVLGAALHWQGGQDKLLILVPDQLLVYTITTS